MYGQLGANQVSREHYRSDTTKNYKDMSGGGAGYKPKFKRFCRKKL